MESLKVKTIKEVIRVEGGYVDDPDDSGGETRYGITRSLAIRYGYTGDMRDLPYDAAFNIYAAEFWDKLHGDDLMNISEPVTAELMDTAVNTGKSRAVRFLQDSLNVLNRRGKLYSDIAVDGVMGGQTLRAVGEYISHRDERALLRALNCLQGAFYIDLAARRQKDEEFIYGWLMNRVVIQ